MEELIRQLIEKQNDINKVELERMEESRTLDNDILNLQNQLSQLLKFRDIARKPYDNTIGDLEIEQENIKEEILRVWDGEKKTLKFDSGTLKFRTTGSLDIRNPPALLENLMDHLSTAEEVMDYVTGFNKTAVKRYIVVHKIKPDIVELVSKTSVSFVENQE